ncbi:AAA family ATPase, partial [bacterium]|nr:AAA family ATPase [bacterium]
MLKSLEIQNYALLDHVSVEFGNGLIILTGETGAGKSIFIDALGAILGEKVNSSVIRQGAPKAIVEAVFSTEESHEVQQILKSREIWDDSGDVILRREVLPSGRTRCFANDTPINQQVLIELGDLLVDLHGQHQHQSLLKVNEHIRLLDQFGGFGAAVSEISELYQKLREIQKAMETLRSNEARFAERREILKFQLREIMDVTPEPGEEES